MVNTGIVICGMLLPDSANALGLFTVCAVSNFTGGLKKLGGHGRYSKAAANEVNRVGDSGQSRVVFFPPSRERYETTDSRTAKSNDYPKQTSDLLYLIKNNSFEFLQSSTSTTLPSPLDNYNFNVWNGYFKRIFDICSSLFTLLLLAPLFLTVILLLKIFDPGPVFFSQPRIGKNGCNFPCYKFRTMTMNADKILEAILANDPAARSEWDSIQKLTIDPRVTRLGKFLRVSSIDELPQLLNVLKGEMSFIGPRPIVDSESARYGRYFNHYCVVKPGLTGLWQVSGRNLTTYRRRVALDTYYAKHVSLKLDMLIVLKTFPAVLFQRGVS